jgi:hypothetical protein
MFGMPDLDYDVQPETDDHGLKVLSFRAPGSGLRRLYMDGASQLRQHMEAAGERDNAAEVGRLIDRATGRR